ncbi:MAG: hypothetical protein J4G16_12950 [Acidobacteria bacterium]|nr:hypothetical protein [Acidobacteriota bacterium]
MDLLRYKSGPHRIEIACCLQPQAPQAVAGESFEAQAFLVLDDDTPPVTAPLSAPSAAGAVQRVHEYLDSMGYEDLVALEQQPVAID